MAVRPVPSRLQRAVSIGGGLALPLAVMALAHLFPVLLTAYPDATWALAIVGGTGTAVYLAAAAGAALSRGSAPPEAANDNAPQPAFRPDWSPIANNAETTGILSR